MYVGLVNGDLRAILLRSGIVSTIGQLTTTIAPLEIKYPVTVAGATQPEQLSNFLEILKSTIIVDLSPLLVECYALGPYTVFDAEESSRSSWGESLNSAKYRRDQNELLEMLGWIEDFIGYHPSLKTVDSIVAAPKGDPNTPDLAGKWAQEIASAGGCRQLSAHKTPTAARPQKELSETDTEEDLIARVAHTITVEGVKQGSRVLILDDTIRSGGTLIEMARALREAGAAEVYGLAVAKDAKFTRESPGFLDRERWE